MTEFFLQYGLFLAKTVTIVAALGAIIAMIAAASKKQHHENGFKLVHLNEQYEDAEHQLKQGILTPEARKQAIKEEKAAKKAEKKAQKKRAKKEGAKAAKPRAFVLDFQGDIRATGVSALREELTAVLSVATPEDEIVVHLENAGGLVHEHGLAASQLQRVRARGIPLTVLIDKVAASGGYMMACVANRIIAAPFAIVGSIGVLAQIPNFHRMLDRHGVDFEQLTAGEYKRTLTMFGVNTDKGRAKFQEELEDTHLLFKDFVRGERPALDIDSVATGEHWFGTRALDRKLVDELMTSDDYLWNLSRERDLYKVTYETKKTLAEKIASALHTSMEKVTSSLWQREQEGRFWR